MTPIGGATTRSLPVNPNTEEHMTDTTTKDMREATLARIRALMAKTTDNGCTEAEAEAAAKMVDRLLALYEIDLDEVTVREQELVQLIVADGEHAVRMAGLRIAAFCDCKVWTVENRRKIAYFGFKIDTEIAEYLTLLFKRAIDQGASDYTAFNQDYNAQNRNGRNEMLHSFRAGMASRLGDRLTELKSKRDFAQRGTGRDLVAIKMPLVEDGFAALGISLGRASRGRGARDQGAYVAGRNAAEGVAINQGIGHYAEKRGMIR